VNEEEEQSYSSKSQITFYLKADIQNTKIRDLCCTVLTPLGTSYREALVLDATIDHILNFAKSNGETLVLITADHECGGT
jgi:hypothetical protein